MSRYAVIKVALILMFFGVIMVTSFASSDNNPALMRQGPPAEAIEVCRDKQAGDRVVFTDPQGETVPANCRNINGELAALPEEFPAGLPPQPMKYHR